MTMPAPNPGWYLGLEAGSARSSFGTDNVDSVLERQGLVATGVTTDRTASSYSLYGGYRFTPFLSVEGGYVNLGRREFSSVVGAAGGGTLNGHSHPQGLFVRAVGTVPLAYNWSAYGRLGVVNTRSRLSGTGTGAAGDFGDNTRWHASATYGLGLSWAVHRNVDVLVGWDRWNGIQPDYSGRSFKIDSYNAGLRYSF